MNVSNFTSGIALIKCYSDGWSLAARNEVNLNPGLNLGHLI